MTNPFDRHDGYFLVLVNAVGQHSLWPAEIDVPDGWSRRSGPSPKDECLALIEREWTDLTPRREPDARADR